MPPASARLSREIVIAKARVSCPPTQKSECMLPVWQCVYSTAQLAQSPFHFWAQALSLITLHTWCGSWVSLWKDSCCEHSLVSVGWLSGLSYSVLHIHERPSALSQQDLHTRNSPASPCHSVHTPSRVALSWWSETRAFLVENDCPVTKKFKIKKQLLIKSWRYSHNIQWGWNNSTEKVLILYQIGTGFGFMSYPHL